MIHAHTHIPLAGIYYPKGGFGEMTKLLETVAREKGVHIRTNCTVTNVTKCSDNDNYHVKYGENDDEYICAKRVISNIDVPALETSDILPSSKRDTNLHTARSSISVLSLSLALNITLSSLEHHTLFFSEFYDDSWDCVEKSYRKDDGRVGFNAEICNFYVHAPSRTDESVCPKDHDAITVLVPIPLLPTDNNNDSNYNNNDNNNNGNDNNDNNSGNKQHEVDEDLIVKQIRNEILHRLSELEGISKDQLESCIVAERCRSAIDWKQVRILMHTYSYISMHTLTHTHTLTNMHLYIFLCK